MLPMGLFCVSGVSPVRPVLFPPLCDNTKVAKSDIFCSRDVSAYLLATCRTESKLAGSLGRQKWLMSSANLLAALEQERAL